MATSATDGHSAGGFTGHHEHGEAPMVGSSLVAMAAETGIQLDSFSLGGPAEYLASDGERDVLMVRFLRSIAAFLADGTCQMQVNDGLRSVVDLVGAAAGEGRCSGWCPPFAEVLALRFILPCVGVCRSLHLMQATPSATISTMRQWFHAMCPIIRLAAAVSNLSITKVMDAKQGVIHVVDLSGGVTPTSGWCSSASSPRDSAARPTCSA